MKNSIILRVMILGVLSMMGIIAVQTYWVTSTWSINEEEFGQKVNLALYNTARALAEQSGSMLPSRDIIKRRTSNYYVVNLENVINADYLEYYLQREFESLALNVDFEYAVFDCHTDEMVYGNYCNYSTPKKDLVLGNLPKDSEFLYYFGVRFPTRSSYLFGKMQLSVFFSFILLLTTVFFAYSMFVILRQKRLSEMQKEFINNMTHEFKTPISTIKVSADVLFNAAPVQADARLHKYASIIQAQNERLNSQVEKVLQLAKIERGSFALKREDVELRALLLNVAESARLRVDALGGHFACELPEGAFVIAADRLHLTNILHNLLDNAIKYCRAQPHIVLSLRITPTTLDIRIADTGIGIAKEYQNRIFDKFFRIPTGNLHNIKGFGLGLFYVKSICDAHQWQLYIHSQIGEGTQVSIQIPYSVSRRLRDGYRKVLPI